MILSLLTAAALALPAAAESPLDKKISVQAAPGLEFHEICKASGLPCGIEVDAAASGDPSGKTPFRAEDTTVSGALSRAILRYPGHRWRFRKGVIYVTPNALDAASPLDKVLGKTKFDESLESARADFGAAAGFCSAPRAPDSLPKPRSARKYSFEAAEGTPRAVLNALVFRHGRSAWIVERASTSGKSAIYCLDLFDYDD